MATRNRLATSAMAEVVLASLRSAEAEHDVTVLFACESSCHGQGAAMPGGGYHVGFIHVHRLSWYLSIERSCDAIECPSRDGVAMSGWDLRKALRLLRHADLTLLQWLNSPVIYLEHREIMQRFRRLAAEAVSRGSHRRLTRPHDTHEFPVGNEPRRAPPAHQEAASPTSEHLDAFLSDVIWRFDAGRRPSSLRRIPLP